jgi:hypothetical protein
LLQAEGVKLPSWVKLSAAKAGKLRNPEKLRRNRPAEPEAPAEEAAETPADEVAEDAPAEEATETASEDAPAEAEAAADAEA